MATVRRPTPTTFAQVFAARDVVRAVPAALRLLKAGVQHDDALRSALAALATRGEVRALTRLLDAGAPADAALVAAAATHHADVVDALLQHGAEASTAALTMAICASSFRTVRMLVRAGAVGPTWAATFARAVVDDAQRAVWAGEVTGDDGETRAVLIDARSNPLESVVIGGDALEVVVFVHGRRRTMPSADALNRLRALIAVHIADQPPQELDLPGVEVTFGR